ncbi:MAG TPA: FtsX-like permease family protein, partial [Candidatus Nanoarchaeia archaeon]|nr:FtsX-like permease family protein [Candidatus Nanoarchaeia archaeon]
RLKEDIEQLLRKERDVKEGEEDFTVESPQSILESLDSTLFAVQLFVSIIAAISLFVGGIGIMNTMYTSVVERTRQIGIMKSVGAKNSTIFSLFFLESGLLGAAGGIIGIVLGLIMAYGLAAFGRLVLGTELIQAQVSWTLILGALLFSFVLGTLSGLLPAVQASRMQPVEALRT